MLLKFRNLWFSFELIGLDWIGFDSIHLSVFGHTFFAYIEDKMVPFNFLNFIFCLFLKFHMFLISLISTFFFPLFLLNTLVFYFLSFLGNLI